MFAHFSEKSRFEGHPFVSGCILRYPIFWSILCTLLWSYFLDSSNWLGFLYSDKFMLRRIRHSLMNENRSWYLSSPRYNPSRSTKFKIESWRRCVVLKHRLSSQWVSLLKMKWRLSVQRIHSSNMLFGLSQTLSALRSDVQYSLYTLILLFELEEIFWKKILYFRFPHNPLKELIEIKLVLGLWNWKRWVWRGSVYWYMSAIARELHF